MTETIKISVVVTNYNYAGYLPQCLDSVRAQTYPHVECIVVDDGSTDDSRTVIARRGSGRRRATSWCSSIPTTS